MKLPPARMILLGCLAVGCTSFQRAETQPVEIEQAILSGELVEPGDRVKLATADGTVHEFRVTSIDRERRLILGKDEAVPIADIVAIETREASMGKTALLAGGFAGGIMILILAVLALLPAIVVM